jgi:hypothetical protein
MGLGMSGGIGGNLLSGLGDMLGGLGGLF